MKLEDSKSPISSIVAKRAINLQIFEMPADKKSPPRIKNSIDQWDIQKSMISIQNLDLNSTISPQMSR